MKIRSIASDEVSMFSELSGTKEKQQKYMEFLEEWFQEEKSKPEWCFVADEENTFIARIMYWIFPHQPNQFKIASLTVPQNNEEAFFEIGRQLIIESCRKLSEDISVAFEYHLNSKNNDFFDNYRILFQDCGFVISQEKSSYLYEGNFEENKYSDITFRSLSEVGEKAFIKAIECVSVDTLDRDDQSSIESLGPVAAALDYYNTLCDIDLMHDWWQLAYDKEDELIGLVVPQKMNDTVGAINYIGVVPDKRGNGYVNELLIKGTHILNKNGFHKVIADIDVNNIPLAQALNKNGYKLDSRMINYKK